METGVQVTLIICITIVILFAIICYFGTNINKKK